MSICFLIPTYNRQQSCQLIVNSLQGQGDIFVLNDGSDYTINRCNFFSNPYHQGKQGYYRTINTLFSLPTKIYSYYFILPDDHLPADDMVSKAISTWEGINDSAKLCLNILSDRIGKPCWTNFLPIEYYTVYKTQWVDMCFLTIPFFFSNLGSIPKPNIDWNNYPNMSSGVGRYISVKLNKHNFSLYQVKESLVSPLPDHLHSQMHHPKTPIILQKPPRNIIRHR